MTVRLVPPQIIPLTNAPNQTVNVTLGGQSCRINIYTKSINVPALGYYPPAPVIFPPTPPVPVPFSIGGVSFDGATILDLAALATTDSAFLLYSYWWQDASDQGAKTTWEIDPTGSQFVVEFPGGDGIISNSPNIFVADDPFTGNRLQFGSNTTGTFNAWHHNLVAMDLAHSAGARPHWMYQDDADVTSDNLDDGTTFIISSNGKQFVLGGDGFGNDVTMLIADFWWGLGQFLDLSVTANRRKFISSTGTPVDLGTDGSTPTGTAPAFFLHRSATDPAEDFAIDRTGNGNDFTITGTLTAVDGPSL